MKTLSGLDATFLYLETPETPMHVGSLHLYDLPTGFKGSFHSAVTQHMAGRIHLSPIFTCKLAFMPFNLGHPHWVDDENFDIENHIVKIGKTYKGKTVTEKMAQDIAASLHGELIDRNRPLWLFTVFDSILRNNGERCAGFYSKIHHAALDGKGGTVLANAVLDVSEVPREVPMPNPAHPRKAPDVKMGELIGSVLSNSLAQYAKLAKSLPAAAAQIGNSLAKSGLPLSAQKASDFKAQSPLNLAPKTLFNVAIGAERVFVTASLPFAECRTMAKTLDASFNDMVLWICATALRSYLAQHAEIPAKSLIAAMPVSLRDESSQMGKESAGNQASMTLANLGTHIAHPIKRMQAIMVSTAKVKKAMVNLKSILPTDYPGLLAPLLVGGAAKLAFKAYGNASIAERLPLLANVVISNVPGPQVPLYLAGARMMTFHPLSIVMHGLGVNFTIQTYAGRVDFGIIAADNALPHAQDLADAVVAAFEEARGLYALGRAAAVKETGKGTLKGTLKGAVKGTVKTPVKAISKSKAKTSVTTALTTPAKKRVSPATKKLATASKLPAKKAATLAGKSRPVKTKANAAR